MVSVILRCRNEEKYIGFAIQSIYDFLGYAEIILVDNESTDNSNRIVNSFEFMNIKKVKLSKNDYTPGRSINLGLEHCTNDYVLVMSSHCQITKLDFNDVKNNLDSGFVSVWGRQNPIWNGKKISHRYMWANFKDEPKVNYFSKYEDRYFLHNGFAFYNKYTLIDSPFDEHWSSKEDRYWANDMVENGTEIYYDPDISVNHFYTQEGATWKGVG